MKNPNTKMMRLAGFKCSRHYHNDAQIWTRGDIRITVGPRKMSLYTLVGYAMANAVHRAQLATRLARDNVKL